jgi:YVTN family beta-propeller protein
VGLVLSLAVGLDAPVGLPVGAILLVGVIAFAVAWARRDRSRQRQDAAAAVRDPRRVASVRGVGKNPQCVTLGPDGRLAYVAASDSGTLAVVDLEAREVRALIDVGRGALSAAAVPGSGLVLVSVVGGRGRVKIVDPAAGRVTGQVEGIGDSRDIAVSPDGSAMYVASFSDDQVVRLDPRTLTVTGRGGVAGRPAAVAVSPDGTRLYVGALRSAEVVVLDAGAMTHLATIPVGVRPRRLAADPHGVFVYAACADGNVAVINALNRRLAHAARPARFEGGIAVSPDDGALCYLVDPDSDSLLLLGMPDIRVRGRVAFGAVHAIDVAAGSDGLVYVAGQNGTLEIVRP